MINTLNEEAIKIAQIEIKNIALQLSVEDFMNNLDGLAIRIVDAYVGADNALQSR